MKILRFTLSVVMMGLCPLAFAQSDMHKPADTPAPSAAQKSFATIKTVAGEWEGLATVAEMPEMKGGAQMHLSLRVTSRGNAVVHEFQEANTPLDPSKFDHPVTMMYVDGEQLNLVHYCDAGNRPRMTGKLSPDGKSVEFTFADVSGSTKHGYMQHAVFTYIDATHHTEDWTFMMPGDKPMHAHFDLHRVN
jgi:hypothetical protein